MENKRRAALRLWIVMSRALRSIEKQLERQVEQHELSLTEFAVLEVLLHKGPQPIGDIGNQVLLTSGSMTYVIDKLEKRNLLTRTKCEEDGRVHYAELTDDGTAKIKSVFPEHAQLITQLMSAISVDEQMKVADLLKKVGLHANQEAAH